MSETKYTAMRASGFLTRFAPTFDDFLRQIGEFTAEFGLGAYDSWCFGMPTYNDQNIPNFTELRAESIAAGRTIKYVNGKYVARGVPAESREEKKEESFDSVFDAFFGIKSAAEPKRARLTWADTKPVDRFPGFSVASDTGPMVEERERHPLQNCASLEPRGFKG